MLIGEMCFTCGAYNKIIVQDHVWLWIMCNYTYVGDYGFYKDLIIFKTLANYVEYSI